jgi:chromate transporter
VSRLAELARVFLRLGLTSFGGPAVHVAMMEDELVGRRAWLSRERFVDLLGVSNLLPGPSSTELALHIGHERAGWRGLLVAGACFIGPAVLLTLLLAYLYVEHGARPEAAAILAGVKPVVIAVIVQALARLARSAIKSVSLAALGAAAAVACLLGAPEIAVLVCAGLLAAGGRMLVLIPVVPATFSIFFTFLKIGGLLFGSGYVLVALLRSELVERLGWLTETQLLDAVAVGQVTPGPLFSTGTFIGYLIDGLPGAGLATLGIFLPAFVFVALSAPLVAKLRGSRAAAGFLDGVNAASLALMGLVCVQLGQAAFVDWVSVGLGVASAGLLLATRVSSAWLVLGGALIGLLRTIL